MVTRILWFLTDVWVSDSVLVCFFQLYFFSLFMKKVENLHKYHISYISIIVFTERSFVQLFSPL